MSIEYLNISETYIIYYTSFLFCLQNLFILVDCIVMNLA